MLADRVAIVVVVWIGSKSSRVFVDPAQLHSRLPKAAILVVSSKLLPLPTPFPPRHTGPSWSDFPIEQLSFTLYLSFSFIHDS